VLINKSNDELLEIAKENSESVNAKVIIKKKDELAKFLKEYIEKIQAKKLMLPSFGDEKWENFNLKEWLNKSGAEKVDYWINDLSRMEKENLVNDDDIELGFVDYLIANT